MKNWGDQELAPTEGRFTGPEWWGGRRCSTPLPIKHRVRRDSKTQSVTDQHKLNYVMT